MPSTFSPLKIELIATGEQSGTWGNTTNTNLGTAIEEAITGSADVAFSSADVTVTLTDTNAAQTARNLRLNLTGTSGGARNLILGSGCQIEKLYLINNGLADAVTVKNTTGTGIAVPAGKSMFVYNNGTNVVEAVNSAVTLETTQVNITGQGDLRLEDSSGGQYVALQAPATVASSYTLTMPVDDGTSGQALITDGNGVLSWSTAASGDVYGPASATDNAIARFDLTTGKLIQNSSALVDDSGNVLAGAGTVSVPAFSTTGDTNTGIFFPAADTIAFTEGGAESMRIDSIGQVGIGQSPNASQGKLQINQALGGTVNGAIRITDNATTSFVLNNTSSGVSGIWTSGVLTFGTGNGTNTERMRIDSSGNVGIGTSSPAAKLQVNDTTSASATSLIRMIGQNSYQYDIQSLTTSGSLVGARLGFFVNSGSGEFSWSTSSAERMRIDSSGNVGIGTASPSVRLDVQGGRSSFSANSENFSVYLRYNNSTSGFYIGSPSADAMAFSASSGAERMRITSDGNLLVNTSTARTNFFNSTNTPFVQVEGTTFATSSYSTVRNSNDNAAPFLILAKSRGTTVGSNTVVNDADQLGALSFQGNDGTEFVDAARITASVDGTPGANDMPGRLAFFTTADGASTLTERMRIDSSGNVMIGGTTTTSATGYTFVNALGSNGGSFEVYSGTTRQAYYYCDSVSANIGSLPSIPLILRTNALERMRINAGAPILCLSGGNTTATGTGIAFPATQSASSDANTLDDYEEGTWTPSYTLSLGSVSGVTSAGSYIKIGRQVTVNFYITFTTATAASIDNITGLPFTVVNTSQLSMGVARENANTGFLWQLRPTNNSTTMLIRLYNNADQLASGYSFYGSVTYFSTN